MPGQPLMSPLSKRSFTPPSRKRTAAARGRRNWSWVNRPITLWLLSTVAVGVLSFTYSQYSACRASFAINSSRFARLSEELVFRVGGIYGVTLT